MTTGGTVYNTFTPDSGLTETVLHFLEKPKVGEQAKFVSIISFCDEKNHKSFEGGRSSMLTNAGYGSLNINPEQ